MVHACAAVIDGIDILGQYVTGGRLDSESWQAEIAYHGDNWAAELVAP